METFAYTLEKYNGPATRHTCPSCGKKREFARYIDAEGNHIADHVGRCNRESSCGYHFKPGQYFENNPGSRPAQSQPIKHFPTPEPEYISPDVLKSTLKEYERNTFVQYLRMLFDDDRASKIVEGYGLGTTKDSSCIFWQVDQQGRIRTGKVIKYNPDGHRDKTIPPYFIHTKLGIKNIRQCLFGEHLLKTSDNPIGLVESEKTACIMSGKLPDFLWMATGGKLNLKQVEILKGRKVVAFPDTDGYNEWKERLSPYGFKISDTLQQFTDEPGLDLADFVTSANNHLETLNDGREIEICVGGYPAEWNLN